MNPRTQSARFLRIGLITLYFLTFFRSQEEDGIGKLFNDGNEISKFRPLYLLDMHSCWLI